MINENLDLNQVDGISYTVYRDRSEGGWLAFVHPNDGKYSHRDFLLSKIAEGKTRGVEYEFSSCGILAYDSQTQGWFPTFETSYADKPDPARRQEDMELAIQAAQKTYGNRKVLMAHLGHVGAEKIANQRLELAKVGLPEEQIEKIVSKNAKQREQLNLCLKGRALKTL